MKIWSALVLAVLLGLASGWLLRGLSHRDEVRPFDESGRSAIGKDSAPKLPPAASDWSIPTGASLHNLEKLPNRARRVAEVAVALGSASPSDLAVLWSNLTKDEPGDYQLKNLVMTRWVELVPRQALEATLGSKDEEHTWRCWGRGDPTGALREAEARESGYLWRVLQGVGETDPDLAIELMKRYPSESSTEAIRNGLQNQSWQAAVEFDFASWTLDSWAKYEPREAFAWALEHARLVDKEYGWPSTVARMLAADPEGLDAAIAELPSGRIRQKLLTEKVRFLATQDVDAAVAVARASESPYERALLMSTVGSTIVASDPQRSLELHLEILSKTGIHGSGFPSSSWLKHLLAQDAPGVLETTRESAPEYAGLVARTWMASDFDGFVEWAQGRPEVADRDRCYGEVAGYFLQRGRFGEGEFPEALEWAEAVETEETRRKHLEDVISQWRRGDSEGAAAFFDGDEASDDARAIYQFLRKGDQE